MQNRTCFRRTCICSSLNLDVHFRAASIKPKSLQTSVSKRGARAESFLVSLLVLLVFPSVLAKASQDSIFHTVQYWDGF